MRGEQPALLGAAPSSRAKVFAGYGASVQELPHQTYGRATGPPEPRGKVRTGATGANRTLAPGVGRPLRAASREVAPVRQALDRSGGQLPPTLRTATNRRRGM